MSLVEPPRSLHRDPHQIHVVEYDLQSPNRALEHRSKSHIESEPVVKQQFSCVVGFFYPGCRQIDVGPACKAVLAVPITLTVTKQN